MLCGVVAAVAVLTSAAPLADDDKTDVQPSLDIEVNSTPAIDLISDTTKNSPTPEETKILSDSNSQTDIEQLLEQADPIENDITDAIISSTLTTTTPSGEKNTTKDDSEKLLTPEGMLDAQTTTTITPNEEKIEEQTGESNLKVSDATEISITDEGTVVEDLDEIVEIDDNTEDVTDTDTYQTVQEETEMDTPALSEYTPDVEVNTHDIPGMPFVESIIYDYPPDNIVPSSVFRPDQSPNMDDYPANDESMMHAFIPGHPMSSSPDYINDYDLGLDENFHANVNGPEFSHPLDYVDYPTDDQFGLNYDYPSDYPSAGFDETTQYDTFHEQPMGSNADYDSPSMTSDFPIYDSIPMVSSVSIPHVIVAGANENFSPKPILGMIPHLNSMQTDNVNIPLYDDSITPGGMIKLNTPVIESTQLEDQDTISSDSSINLNEEILNPISEYADEEELLISGGGDVDLTSVDDQILPITEEKPTVIDPTKEIVIKLDYTNKAAFVNGQPFAIRESNNLLGFIEKMLNVATMNTKIPSFTSSNSNFSPQRYYYHGDMGPSSMHMEQEPYYDHEDPPFTSFDPYYYSDSYGHEPPFNKQYSMSYDFPRMHPFLSNLKRRLFLSRMNALQSARNIFGYDSAPRFQRNAPYFANDEPWYKSYW